MSATEDEIAAKRHEIAAAMKAMAATCEAFTVAAGSCLGSWHATAAQEDFLNRSAHGATLTDEQVSELQANAQRRGEAAPVRARETLANAALWWHLNSPPPIKNDDLIPHWHYGALGSPAPARQRIDAALGKLATEHRAAAGGAQRRVTIPWSDEMTALIRQYEAQKDKAVACSNQLSDLETKQRREAAATQWQAVLNKK